VESADENTWNLQQDKENMAFKKLKIVIWCGHAANQRALANKIAAEFDVAGIVIDTHTGNIKKRSLIQLPGILWNRLRFYKIYSSWSGLMKYYGNKFPRWPEVPQLKVPDINIKETETFTKELQPDLIIVSGTALIKEPIINIPFTIGIINLHTGLSPYVKGGPNCTNWCIANNTFELVGNTIMWLNAGIDAGNIITTQTVDIKNTKDIAEAHQIVMDQAHNLYLKAIRYLSEKEPPYNSVPQSSIDSGQLFLTKMWTTLQKKNLMKNWKKRSSHTTNKLPKTIPLVS
jgi:Formyl transferase